MFSMPSRIDAASSTTSVGAEELVGEIVPGSACPAGSGPKVLGLVVGDGGRDGRRDMGLTVFFRVAALSGRRAHPPSA